MLGSSRSNRINVLPGLLGRLDGTWRALNALRSTLPVDVASPAGRSGLVTVLSLCRSRANATPGTRPSSSTCAIPPGSEDYVVIDAARNPLQRDLPTTQFDGDGAYPHVISVAGCVFKYAPEASIVKTNPKGGLEQPSNPSRGKATPARPLDELRDAVCTQYSDIGLRKPVRQYPVAAAQGTGSAAPMDDLCGTASASVLPLTGRATNSLVRRSGRRRWIPGGPMTGGRVVPCLRRATIRATFPRMDLAL
jgi:hypothetical protein